MSQSFPTLEQAYKELFNDLNAYARKHLIRKDESIDAIHEAFEKLLSSAHKGPQKDVKRNKLFKETFRACKRRNKAITEQQLYIDTQSYAGLAQREVLGPVNKHHTSDKAFDLSGELGYDDYRNFGDA